MLLTCIDQGCRSTSVLNEWVSMLKRIFADITSISDAENKYLVLFVLALVATFVYGHTLDVSWYLDDYHSIIENSRIRDLGTTLTAWWRPRGIVEISFAINFALGATDPAGYHLVNIILHWMTSFAVYLLLLRLFPEYPRRAFFAALIFLVHPVQTQAVTYVVQRATLMAAFFCVLSCYLFARLPQNLLSSKKLITTPNVLTYLAALICGALAVLSKQNTATLPLLLILIIYVRGSSIKNLRNWDGWLVAPFLIVPVLVAYTMLAPTISGSATLQQITSVRDATVDDGSVSWKYFVTQWNVIWIYLRLFFLPIGLKLEYAYPIVQKVFSAQNLIALVGLLGVAAWGVKSFKKSTPITYGVFWFFTALIVESTFIPLDPIFEHRMYLPIIGLIVISLTVLEKLFSKNWSGVIAVTIVCILSTASWARNDLWRQPVDFLKDNAIKTPHSEGVLIALGGVYIKENRLLDAEKALLKAVKLNPNYFRTYINLSQLYIKVPDYQKAMSYTHRGLLLAPGNIKLLQNLSFIYTQTRQPQKAISAANSVISREPDNAAAHALMGINYSQLQNIPSADFHLRKAIQLDPDDETAHFELGYLLYQQGRYHEAKSFFRQGVQSNPNSSSNWLGVGKVAIALDDKKAISEALAKLKILSPDQHASLKSEAQMKFRNM